MTTRLMARRSLLTATAVALTFVFAGPAYASPGDNFPEQPGAHLALGCEALLTNPDRALNFLTGEQHMSGRAAAILVAQYIDACLGG